jgi:putative serine protease PepD
VQAVVPGGPSAQAGLRAGDVITEINGAKATSTDQLAALTLTKREGDTVDVKYVRNGQTSSTTITLGAQP